MIRIQDAQRQFAVGDQIVHALDDVDLDQISPSDRANIYAAAVTIVGIDDEVVPDEERFLERLQKALELDDATAAALRT